MCVESEVLSNNLSGVFCNHTWFWDGSTKLIGTGLENSNKDLAVSSLLTLFLTSEYSVSINIVLCCSNFKNKRCGVTFLLLQDFIRSI